MTLPARHVLWLLLRPLGGALLALPFVGCTSLGSYRYGPQPLEAIVETESGDSLARVLFVLEGIDTDPEPHEVHLRVRIENSDARPIQLSLADWLLLDLALNPFGPATLPGAAGERPLSVPPGGSATVDVRFPFPDPDVELRLDGFNLRWGLTHAGGTEVFSSGFERLVRPVYYVYDYPGLWYGRGYWAYGPYCD